MLFDYALARHTRRTRHFQLIFITALILLIGTDAWHPNPTLASPARAGFVSPVPIPGDGSQTFFETNKTVTGIFLDYWNANGGLAQQGYPISEVKGEISDLDGKPYTVQYFERAVFEYHPENSAPYNVLLSQLGVFQYKQKYPSGAPNQQPNTSPGSQLFAETGHRLGGKFLDYWQSHGGLTQQGFPISDEFTEISDLDGKPYTVQYFERAVFELHPENDAPYDVLLSQLGTFRNQQIGGRDGGPVEGSFDVGGYKLWISCIGQGSTTVLMDSSIGNGADQWSSVQPGISKFARACVYDRAWLGKSNPGPAPRTSEQMVKELHALLGAANVRGPYVLVGGQEGGLTMQLFAKLHKDEVSGLVLVDAVQADLDTLYATILTPEQNQQRKDSFTRSKEHGNWQDFDDSCNEVKAAGALPQVPTIVLRHGLPLPQPPGWPVDAIEKVWLQMQQDLANSVPGAKLIVAESSAHFIQLTQPDLVIQSIQDVVAASAPQK